MPRLLAFDLGPVYRQACGPFRHLVKSDGAGNLLEVRIQSLPINVQIINETQSRAPVDSGLRGSEDVRESAPPANQRELRCRSEPNIGFFKRFGVGFMSLLAID
jgi:hypothetical protein